MRVVAGLYIGSRLILRTTAKVAAGSAAVSLQIRLTDLARSAVTRGDLNASADTPPLRRDLQKWFDPNATGAALRDELRRLISD